MIEAGTLRAAEIARQRGLPAPDARAVEALYRAQIEAAKAIQRAILAGPPTLDDPPDLASQLRPALIRIGDRLAGLIAALPTDPVGGSPDEIRLLTSDALAPQGLDRAHIDAIADAIADIGRRRGALDAADAR